MSGGWLSKLCAPGASQFDLGVDSIIRPSDVQDFLRTVIAARKGVLAFERFQWLLDQPIGLADVYVLVLDADLPTFMERTSTSPYQAKDAVFVLATDLEPSRFPQPLIAQFRDQRSGIVPEDERDGPRFG